MLRVGDSPLKSNTHGEFILPDGHIIVSSCTRSKGKYPLGDEDIFKKKYKKLSVGPFESKKMGIYSFCGYIDGASTGGQGVDKLNIIDAETGAYYVTEMRGIIQLLTGLGEKNMKIYTKDEKTYIEGDVTFEYRGGTVFLEVVNSKKIKEFDTFTQQEKVIENLETITPSKLKPYHRYKKLTKNDKDCFFYVVPFFEIYCNDISALNLTSNLEPNNCKPNKDGFYLVRSFLNLEDNNYKGYVSTEKFTGQFYDETPIDGNSIKSKLALLNKKDIKYVESYNKHGSCYLWFESDLKDDKYTLIES